MIESSNQKNTPATCLSRPVSLAQNHSHTKEHPRLAAYKGLRVNTQRRRKAQRRIDSICSCQNPHSPGLSAALLIAMLRALKKSLDKVEEEATQLGIEPKPPEILRKILWWISLFRKLLESKLPQIRRPQIVMIGVVIGGISASLSVYLYFFKPTQLSWSKLSYDVSYEGNLSYLETFVSTLYQNQGPLNDVEEEAIDKFRSIDSPPISKFIPYLSDPLSYWNKIRDIEIRTEQDIQALIMCEIFYESGNSIQARHRSSPPRKSLTLSRSQLQDSYSVVLYIFPLDRDTDDLASKSLNDIIELK